MSQSLFKRRSLLKQLGAAAFLAAPVFRSVLAEAQAQVPKRFIVVFFPGGLPAGSDGPDLSFSNTLSPLASLEPEITLFKGLSNRATTKWQTGSGGEGHEGGMRTMLTGSTLGRPEGSYEASMTSLDQIIARQIGASTRFTSLELGVLTDAGDEGALQALGHRRITIRDGQAVTPDQDPTALFNRLFMGGTPAPSPTGSGGAQAALDAQNRYNRQKSKLDYLKAQIGSIQAIAGSGEQAKLEQHLTALRELERGLVNPVGGAGGGSAPMPTAGCNNPSIQGRRSDMVKIGEDMTQLAYQALNCDLTRVLTFQWLGSGDQIQTYPWLSINEHHHSLEHGSTDPDEPRFKVLLTTMQTWLMGEIAKFMNLLKGTDTGSGSLLDNSVVLVSTDMATGDHGPDPHTAFLVGKGGGSVRSGRTITSQDTPHNNMLLGVAQAMGVNLTTIGDAEYCTSPISLS